MIAVPNYQDNLYQRLWCVYAIWLIWLWSPCCQYNDCSTILESQSEEIFMASQLKVYVGLAHTLAPAGKCTARTARCSNDEDEARPTNPSFAFPIFAFLRANVM